MTEFEMAHLTNDVQIAITSNTAKLFSIVSGFLVMSYYAAHRLTLPMSAESFARCRRMRRVRGCLQTGSKDAPMRTVVAIVFAFMSSLSPAEAGAGGAAGCEALPVAVDPAFRARVDAIVDAAVAEGFAGQVAVMRGGAFAYTRAAGSADLAGKVPVSEATLYHVASLSKYFTAALALRAAEEGKIDLAAPIAKFVEGTSLAARGVTAGDLLAHASGLGSSYAAEEVNDPKLALAAIDAAGYDKESVGRFRYSNDGYDVVAIVLERAYGAAFESLAHEKTLGPGCARRARFWGEVKLDDPAVLGQPLKRLSATLTKRNYGMMGSAGLLITATDLVAWQHALTSGRILKSLSREALFAPRGEMRLGQATYGAFLMKRPGLGRVLSARGFEDWGDNAILNDYLDCGVTLAVVTSRGPAEDSGRRPFRDTISEAIETTFASSCRPK